MAMNLRWFSLDSPIRGRKTFKRSLLRMPDAGMAAWISPAVGNVWIPEIGVDTRWPADSLVRVLYPKMYVIRNSPLMPSGLLARLPGSLGKGLAARDPCGVPPRETEGGGLSFSFLILPPSVISAPDPTPVSTSLPEPAPPVMFRTRFLPYKISMY